MTLIMKANKVTKRPPFEPLKQYHFTNNAIRWLANNSQLKYSEGENKHGQDKRTNPKDFSTSCHHEH